MSKFAAVAEDELNGILQHFFLDSVMSAEALEIPGNDWLRSPETFSTSMLYANGRFQGLVPGLTADEGFGGHPGLVYKLLMCALCYQIPCIGISISGKVDAEKNPLTYEQKERILQDIVKQIRRESVKNIMKFVKRHDYESIPVKLLKQQIHKKLKNIRLEFRPLQNPFATVLGFKQQFEEEGTSIDSLIMVSGLEAYTARDKEGEYNKYEHTFDKLIGTEEGKAFRSVHFLLTSRVGGDTISGTKIREFILDSDYEQLAKYLLEANFTTDELILDYGTLIPTIKKGLRVQLSQGEEEYPLILQGWMMTHAMNDLEELRGLRERDKSSLTAVEIRRLDELEEREPFLLDFATHSQEASSSTSTSTSTSGTSGTSSRSGRSGRSRRSSNKSHRKRGNEKKSRKQSK